MKASIPMEKSVSYYEKDFSPIRNIDTIKNRV